MIIREIQCRSVLNRSRIPGVDYAINPYTGCAHGCVYCYSDFMRRFRGRSEEWGHFVDVKVNAAQILPRQLSRSRPGLISLSTVTDPYQPVERRYGLTRACLEELIQHAFPVSILTKSALVLRDLDLLARLSEVDVGLTITTLDERLRRIFEPGAPSIAQRLRALKTLAEAGIRTWVFLGPVLPFFSDDPVTMGEMLSTFRDHGAQSVLVDRLNFYPRVWHKVRAVIGRHLAARLAFYEDAKRNAESYSSQLRQQVEHLAQRHRIRCDIVF